MNKNDLIDALVPRLGDRATASLAVEAVVDAVLRQVAHGGTVTITGFGTFEPVERAPRTGRNPHTGEAVPIAATRSPRFRPGTYFKAVVADPDQLPDSGLAGARVGNALPDAGSGTPPGPDAPDPGDDTVGPAGTVGRHGTPTTIRRSAEKRRSAKGGAEATARRRTSPRRTTGTPATVRAERAEPEPELTAEPRRERGGGRRMTIGGEQITRDMINAKKAELARAKDGKDPDDTSPGKDGKKRKKGRKKGKSKKGGDKKDKNKN